MTQFIIAYNVGDAEYTCKVDAPNWDKAERHLLALASTGRVSGEYVCDVPEPPSDDEIYDAAYAAYCRGPNTRELFRMMWVCNPPVSIGWDREELKAFARQIAEVCSK